MAVRASEFDWLGDNYTFSTGAADVDAALQRAFTFEAAGRTVGVFALTLHPDDGGNERDYLENNGDYVAVAEQTIKALEAKGVDLIIGVTHLHMWQDVELAGLKARYPKLAFIVGGHEHEPEYSAGDGMNAAVMKGASNARVVWAIDVDFDAAGTPVMPFSESTAVVDTGLFRFSRNPIYLAMVLALTSIGVIIGDLLPLIVIPAFVLIIQTLFIHHEERVLEQRFGEAYRAYKSRVRRWL